MKQNLKTESGKQAVWFATRSPEDCKPIFEALVKSLVALSDIGNFEYLAKVEFESPKEGVKFPMDPSILEDLVGTRIKIDWSKCNFDNDQMNKISLTVAPSQDSLNACSMAWGMPFSHMTTKA